MSNTTDLIITCFEEDDIVKNISNNTDIDFKLISDGNRCGGNKAVIFESYAACYKCIGKEKIDLVIEEFKKAEFRFPEFAVLIISDDNDVFNGIVHPCG